MMSKVHTVGTTARAAVRTNTARFVRGSQHHKTRNNPILKSKIVVFTRIKVVK